MLQSIRDNSQGVGAKIVIGFIIALMAMFGLETMFSGLMNDTTVAEVDGEAITETEITNGVQNLIMSMGGNTSSLDDSLLRQIALNQIIEDRLLRKSAEDSGMLISSDTIDRQLINTAQFQVGGVFNSDIAVRTMAAQGFTPDTYRAALQSQMVVGQLVNAFASSAFVTEQELERIAALSSQTRDFRFVSVTLGNRTAGEVIDETQIETYYQNNQSQFMNEEEVGINYVLLDKSTMFSEVDVSDEDVMAQYEIERGAASSQTQRRAAHILLETGANLSQEDALAQAEALKARLDQGEDFAALAQEASSDTFSAANGGDIGYSDGTAFPAAVEEALVSMEVGEVSDPVVSEFGVHLVKLTEFTEATFPTFEEAEERIRRELSSAEVDQLYFGRLETMANLAFENNDLQALSEELGLEIVSPEAFTRMGGNSSITGNSNVIAAAFSDEVLYDGINSDVIELDDSRAVVLNLREHNEASLRPLEEVRGEIAAILRTELEKERAREVGEELLAAMRSGGDVDTLVNENNLQWIVQTGASRDAANLNGEVLEEAFALPAPEEGPVYEGFALTNGTYIVLELQAVNAGSVADLDEEERAALVSGFVDASGRSTFAAYLAHLRAEADVVINEAFEEPPLL